MLPSLLALIVAALFTGAAVYINVVEQPARLQLSSASLLREWKPSYRRGFAMQASLALVGGALGLLGWWLQSDWRLLIGALLLLANWPYTLMMIMPTNRKLMALSDDSASGEIRLLIREWGVLHAVRGALGAAATVMFAWAAAVRWDVVG
ncbi:MAG: DUF1772 domain-containing protein [Dongiaceae bacterium]